MDEPWLQWTALVLVALVIGFLITLGSSLLRRRQPDGPDFKREPKPPLPRWGEAARQTFWATLLLSFVLRIAYDIFDLWDHEGVWWLLPRANGVIWAGATIVWICAVIQRGRNARSDRTSAG